MVQDLALSFSLHYIDGTPSYFSDTTARSSAGLTIFRATQGSLNIRKGPLGGAL